MSSPSVPGSGPVNENLEISFEDKSQPESENHLDGVLPKVTKTGTNIKKKISKIGNLYKKVGEDVTRGTAYKSTPIKALMIVLRSLKVGAKGAGLTLGLSLYGAGVATAYASPFLGLAAGAAGGAMLAGPIGAIAGGAAGWVVGAGVGVSLSFILGGLGTGLMQLSTGDCSKKKVLDSSLDLAKTSLKVAVFPAYIVKMIARKAAEQDLKAMGLKRNVERPGISRKIEEPPPPNPQPPLEKAMPTLETTPRERIDDYRKRIYDLNQKIEKTTFPDELTNVRWSIIDDRFSTFESNVNDEDSERRLSDMLRLCEEVIKICDKQDVLLHSSELESFAQYMKKPTDKDTIDQLYNFDLGSSILSDELSFQDRLEVYEEKIENLPDTIHDVDVKKVVNKTYGELISSKSKNDEIEFKNMLEICEKIRKSTNMLHIEHFKTYMDTPSKDNMDVMLDIIELSEEDQSDTEAF